MKLTTFILVNKTHLWKPWLTPTVTCTALRRWQRRSLTSHLLIPEHYFSKTKNYPLQTYQRELTELPEEHPRCISKLRGAWAILSVTILALEIFSFVCLWDSYDSNRSHKEQALRLTLPALCISELNVFFLFTIYFIHFFPLFLFFSPLPVSILSHFWKTGGTGVKLMWWKTTGISLWAICFAVMATLSPLSMALGSLLHLGGKLQISQQLSEVTSQVHGWPLAPCRAQPLLEPAPRPVSAQTLSQWRWAYLFVWHLKNPLRKHVWTIIFICFNMLLIILMWLDFIEQRQCRVGIPNIASN